MTRPGLATQPRRRGSVAAELILVFPILVGFLLGTIEFSILLHARQQILLASREGARIGAHGGSDDEIKATVKHALGDTGPLADKSVVTITRTPGVPPNSRDAVQVCVQIAQTDAAPNLIPFLINLQGEQLAACTVMNLE